MQTLNESEYFAGRSLLTPLDFMKKQKNEPQ